MIPQIKKLKDRQESIDLLSDKLVKFGMPRHCGMCAWLKASRIILSRFKFLVLVMLLCAFYFAPIAFSQDADNAIPPPPVELQFSIDNPPAGIGEVKLKLSLKALEDMHADISCLLPEGIEFVDNGSTNLRPSDEVKILDGDKPVFYPEAAELFVGPMVAGTTKEFSFSVRINNKGVYKLIARAQAMAIWGIKEEVLVIEIN